MEYLEVVVWTLGSFIKTMLYYIFKAVSLIGAYFIIILLFPILALLIVYSTLSTDNERDYYDGID